MPLFSAPGLVDRASRGESFTAGRETRVEGTCLHPHRADREPAGRSVFPPLEHYSDRQKLSESRWVHAASFPVQERGVPHTQVQEHSQTSGGPSAGLQPRSVPGAEPRGPRQKHLRRCGSGLVLIALATGGSLTSVVPRTWRGCWLQSSLLCRCPADLPDYSRVRRTSDSTSSYSARCS